MLSDVATSKQEAKSDITGALIGLIIVLAAVLILFVINKDIIHVDLSFPTVAGGSGGSGSGSGGVPGGDPLVPADQILSCTPQGQGTYTIDMILTVN